MPTSKPKHYVVWKGRRTGIFGSWAACKAQVQGFAGARYKRFDSLSAAQTALQEGAQQHIGIGKAGNPSHTASPARTRVLPAAVKTPSWAVDAACSGNPGAMEYRIVTTQGGQSVYHSPLFAQATNNLGEFLALVAALQRREAAGIDVIYTDSRTARAWLRQGKHNSSLSMDDTLATAIHEAQQWLAAHDIPTLMGYVHTWNSKAWGEIPADFGRK